MVEGAKTQGVIITLDLLLAWNLYLSMDPYFEHVLANRIKVTSDAALSSRPVKRPKTEKSSWATIHIAVLTRRP
jgi:hypothetical protein